MNKQTEALKMAIEALESCSMFTATHDYSDYFYESIGDAIQACKEALEQPSSKNIRDSFNEMLEDKVAYYKGKQPAQEPVATIQQWEHKEGDKWIANELPWDEMPPVGTKLYTHPVPLQNEFAKTKSWQGLSDDEILIICAKMAAKLPNKKIDLIFARAIEQELKEKNHG